MTNSSISQGLAGRRSAPEEMASSVAAIMSLHCIICFDEFNTTTRPPMVLPCGHTYVCLPCTKRLKRCMECRQSLFMPASQNQSTSANSSNNINGENNPSVGNHSSPYNNSHPNNNRFPSALGTRGSAYGGGYPLRRFGAPPATTPPQPPVQVPLPIPKNLVLLSMIEASEQLLPRRQQQQQNISSDRVSTPPNLTPATNHSHTQKVPAGLTDGGVDENNQELMGSPARSVPREVDLHIRTGEENGVAGGNVSDHEDSISSDLGEVVVVMGGSGDSVSSPEEDDDEEEQKESFRLDRVIKSIETIMAGSCGTYAVLAKEGLVVLPSDPRKNGKSVYERQQIHHRILLSSRRRFRDSSAVLKESSSTNCSSALSHSSSSSLGCAVGGYQSSTTVTSGIHHLMACGSSCGSTHTSATTSRLKDVALLRLRKRELERIIHKRKTSIQSSCSSHDGRPASPNGPVNSDKKGEERSVSSENPEESESELSNGISNHKVKTLEPVLQSETAEKYSPRSRTESWSSSVVCSDRFGSDVKMAEREPSPLKDWSLNRSALTSPPSDKVTLIAPTTTKASPGIKDKEPFRIQYGQRVQAVSFVDGVVTLARNQGFILATHSQLVKVGPPLDESCRLEGLLENISREGRELESKLKRNAELCAFLFQNIERVQRNHAEKDIITLRLPSRSPQSSPTPDQQPQVKGLQNNNTRPFTVNIAADNNPDDVYSLIQSSSVDQADTAPPSTPLTPPAQLLQPSLQTPTAPMRVHPTTSIEPMRGILRGGRGLLVGCCSPSSMQTDGGGTGDPDTPKTIDNSDLDQHTRQQRSNNNNRGVDNSDDYSLTEQPPTGNNNFIDNGPRPARRAFSVENDQMDLIFGCGTSLLSSECLPTTVDDRAVRDLFLPSPRPVYVDFFAQRYNGNFGEDDEEGEEVGETEDDDDDDDFVENYQPTSTRPPQQPEHHSPTGAPSTPRTTTAATSARPNFVHTPESMHSTSTLTPVLQPISSFDSAVNFRTGFSGHTGLAVGSMKRNHTKTYLSSPQHHQQQSQYQQQQQHYYPNSHGNHHSGNQPPRRRLRMMMGEHRGLGLRLDVRQAMSSWGITHPS